MHVNRFAKALLLTVAVSVAAAALAQSGGGEDPSMTPDDTRSAPVVFTLDDAGIRETVAQGTVVEVALTARPGTGYAWRIVANDPEKLEPLGEPTLEDPETHELGGETRQVFRFRAVEPGSVALEWRYLRPWEDDAEPAQVFRLTLEIV